MSAIEMAKKKAAIAAVKEFVSRDTKVLGIGSGSTVVYAVEEIGRLQREETKVEWICIPSSFQATQLILQHGLKLGTLLEYPEIDVAIDGADEVDENLNCIKGGGGCHLQEKIVIKNAKLFVVVADERKDSKVLGEQWKNGVPVEVVPMAYTTVARTLQSTCNAKSVLRMAKHKAGPVVTDNGNFILDATYSCYENPKRLEEQTKLITGVVEVGLFCEVAVKAFFGQQDGSVTTRIPC